MRALELKDKRVVIWGTGREGVAAGKFIRAFLPEQKLIFVDESAGPDRLSGIESGYHIVRDDIAAVLRQADVVVKSPGVSLYHPLIAETKARGAAVTSLLNLWFAEPERPIAICVTGTKGKSTTASLIAHALRGLGKRAEVFGNIGVPLRAKNDLDYAVIEVSSYQAADFDGMADIAVLTSLYPEHLDWHGSLADYYRDKLNVMRRAHVRIADPEAWGAAQLSGEVLLAEGDVAPPNAYLARRHNLANVRIAMTLTKHLGLDAQVALAAMADFTGLPHRQHELGIRGGLLFVDDSISTTPQSAIAAMEAYKGRPVTLIAGGHDRGIDYKPLVDYIAPENIHAVICLGPSGARIAAGLRAAGQGRVFDAADMAEVAVLAKQHTPDGGVVLLSPAAPSYGLFKDFIERGEAFAKACGF